MSANIIAASFEKFMDAADVSDVTSAFDKLKATIEKEAGYYPSNYDEMKAAVFNHVTFKRKSLFGFFDTRIKARSDITSTPADSLASQWRVVISGAGPCGLRAAVECAMLGYDTTVIELRGEFSRHNIMKTWQPTISDLMNFGLIQFYPLFKPHGHLHLGIREMQMSLLKVALILGVNVHYNTGVCGLVDPAVQLGGAESTQKSWAVWTLPSADARARLRRRAESESVTMTEEVPEELALRPGEQDTSRLQKHNKVDYFEPPESEDGAIVRPAGTTSSNSFNAEDLEAINAPESKAKLIHFDSLLIAEGESSRLIRHLGFGRKVWKFGQAIGVVVNLAFSPAGAKSASSPERQLDEYVIARASATWRQGPLGKLADEYEIELENLEYMRGLSTHFFVATVKKSTLVKFGVLREQLDTMKEFLSPSNVDVERLRAFGRALATASSIPEDAPFCDKNGVQIFDFSCKGQCTDTLKELVSVDPELKSSAHGYVLPIGDALVNPFWPQGLGVNRGFHSALDAVWASHVLRISGHNYDLALYERMTAWGLMNSGVFRTDYLTPNTPNAVSSPSPPRPAAKKDDSTQPRVLPNEWTPDPITRYSALPIKGIHFHDISNGSARPSLPRRYREQFGLVWDEEAAEKAAARGKVPLWPWDRAMAEMAAKMDA
ncbi:hypothetical protein BJ742DRAFT_533351 [Cladochytrium replicatum]|nr:hypothetical protein BJ742DRAFT_533351 [Cladochytrium replicatum]